MRTATLRLEDLKTTIINMGYVGENEHKQIRFDGEKMFQEYPNASVSLTVCPACGEAYPATIERDGDFVLWTITDSDLVAEGCGEIQLTFTESPHIAKSYICRTKVLRSLVPTGDIPSGLDDFITRADALLDELEDAIPEGGTTGQVLAKKSGTDYDTEWVNQSGGGSSVVPAFTRDMTSQTPNIYTCNMTWDDVKSAIDNNLCMMCKIVFINQYGSSEDYLSFIGIHGEDDDVIEFNSAIIVGTQVYNRKIEFHENESVTFSFEQMSPYEKPENGIPASDLANGVIPNVPVQDVQMNGTSLLGQNGVANVPDPSSIIDDTEKGAGKTYSSNKIDSELQGVKSEINTAEGNLETLANKGFYTEEVDNNIYLHFSIGQVSSIDLSIYTSAVDRAYRFLTAEEEQKTLKFDSSVYNILIIYVNGESVASATRWLGTSPIVFDSSVTHTSVVINVKRLDGAVFSQNELDGIIYYTESERVIGNLATKEYVDKKTTKGIKCIYPDGFTSRIKPDIYFNGSFYADLDIDSYKLTGAGEVWVSTDGNDTTGTGAENNPYATITKALTTSAKTIHIKAGTYVQETHYSKWADLKGRNFIGHGTVVFQNDSAGHTLTATGSAYFENITFKHGNSSVNPTFTASCTESNQHICFVKCVFCDAGDNGLSVLGIDAVLVECVAHSNKLDGFNYHKNTSNGTDYIPNVIEINCSAYDNGSDAGSNTSCNGSTSHEGARVIRLNGEYYSCYGGVIADIADVSGTVTISVNYGVLAHESTVTGDNCASFWASSNTEMYLYDCSCYGGTYDITALNDAKVVSRRLTTGRDVPEVNKSNSATVIQY